MNSLPQSKNSGQKKVSASNLPGLAGLFIIIICFLGSLAVSFSIGVSVWGWDSFSNGDACIWMTLLLFFPLVIITLMLLSSRFTYTIENGQFSYGSRELFKLHEIVAWRKGLPDNWTKTAAKYDPLQFSAEGSVFEALNDRRKIVYVFQLTDSRWFFWTLGFVPRLQVILKSLTDATENELAVIPTDVLASCKLLNCNTKVVRV